MRKMIQSIYGVAFSSLGNGLRTVTCLVTSFISTGVNIAGPFALIAAIGALSNENDERKAYNYIALYGAAWTGSRILPLLRNMLLCPVSSELSHKLMLKVIDQYYKLPLEYRTSHSSSPEVQHYSNTYEHIGTNLVQGTINDLLPALIEMISTGVVIGVYFDIEETASLAGLGLLYVISVFIGSRFVGAAQNEWNVKAFEALEILHKRLDNYANALYYNKTAEESKIMGHGLRIVDEAKIKNVRVRDSVATTQLILIGLGLTGITSFGAKHVLAGNIAPDKLISLILLLMIFTNSMDLFAKSLNKVQESFVCFKELMQYLEQNHDFMDDESKPKLQIQTEETIIEFKNVSLKYKDKDDYALKNISFTIHSGEIVAFIGKSGSGKSSILSLLLRLYNPTSGEILINGQNIRTLSGASIRNAFAVIPQSSELINASIEDNIRYVDDKASQPLVDKAIRSADLKSLVDERGMRPIGERGGQLSGGQKQRIAVARAVLKLSKASFLVADEATSSLDPVTEEKVINNIYQIAKESKKTSIVITHRLKTITEQVDRVIVLKNGQLIESDSRSALLSNTNSIFSKQYQLSVGIKSTEEKTEADPLLPKEKTESEELVEARDRYGSFRRPSTPVVPTESNYSITDPLLETPAVIPRKSSCLIS